MSRVQQSPLPLELTTSMNQQPQRDELLISQIAQGNPGALELLYDCYARLIYSMALKIVRDTAIAEEIVQEAFLRVWQGARSYDTHRGRVITWILTITHNLCIDEIRRRKSRPQAAAPIGENDEDPLLQIADPDPSVEETVDGRETSAQVRAAMLRLPPEQYRILELAYFHGLTHKEIAERLQLPLGTAKTRMMLGLKKLKHMLSKSEYDIV